MTQGKCVQISDGSWYTFHGYSFFVVHKFKSYWHSDFGSTWGSPGSFSGSSLSTVMKQTVYLCSILCVLKHEPAGHETPYYYNNYYSETATPPGSSAVLKSSELTWMEGSNRVVDKEHQDNQISF